MRTAALALRIAAIALLALTASALFAVSADAESEIAIPFDDLVFGEPGSIVLLATVDVEPELVGRTCTLAVLAENQASVHIGNDLIVSTGTTQAVIVGVEDTANDGTNQTYEMVVGDTIMVQLRIGQDGMSSLGFGVTFDCLTPPSSVTQPPDLGQQLVERPVETTVPPASSAPAVPTETAAPSTTATTTTTVAPVSPTVAGAVTNNRLPETPAAKAVAGSPAYTG